MAPVGTGSRGGGGGVTGGVLNITSSKAGSLGFISFLTGLGLGLGSAGLGGGGGRVALRSQLASNLGAFAAYSSHFLFCLRYIALYSFQEPGE